MKKVDDLALLCDDAQLASFATVRQLEYLDAIRKHGSIRAAGRALGVRHNAIQGSLAALKRKAALRGYAPDAGLSHAVPPGFEMQGSSVLLGPDGQVKLQWLKTKPNPAEQLSQFTEFLEEMLGGIKGLSPAMPLPAVSMDDLLAVYPIGDQHHGMYADADETGDDYDCGISATRLEKAFSYLSAVSPPAKTALVINCGDFFHADDSTEETPGHKNKLDVDTRYGKVMQSGAAALIKGVLHLLTKHETVHVWNLAGNHDPHASLALNMAMTFYFHGEPRVVVDQGLSLYKYMRFGTNLIGGHHGHGAKPADLPLIMANDRKEDWGATDHRVWHCGHIHHKTIKDYTGCTVETHRTLAGPDAWHAGKGYRAKQDMQVIVYHEKTGEMQRSRFDLSLTQSSR